ncbi:MAG TPA: 2-phosphosulfolactate phosphatase [Mycetocola sp.]|jgi:phosphosulfolactate phosphohydrolase-like enzyme|nr:2-phosphosulfolactate phosphatase [Mycetocola sp.]
MPERTDTPAQPAALRVAAQAKYQVRFDTGRAGLDRVGDVDLLIWVDALALADAGLALDSPAGAVVAANLTNRSAVAAWALDHQVRLGRRMSIAVVSAGVEGTFSAPDLLAAGAVIDALVTLGIDFTSPEAAVTCAAFDNLRKAVGHLFTASVDGQTLIADGERERVVAAALVDSTAEVAILRD